MKTLTNMRTLRNTVAVIAVSTFLFACEADNEVFEDENAIEENVNAGTGEYQEVDEADESER